MEKGKSPALDGEGMQRGEPWLERTGREPMRKGLSPRLECCACARRLLGFAFGRMPQWLFRRTLSAAVRILPFHGYQRRTENIQKTGTDKGLYDKYTKI
ncbi:hypothetical protein TNCV_5033781 [Trichonephila clavipes]|nr:hypothetical protein TNCV_5033781 [Trichonephila clavipes]